MSHNDFSRALAFDVIGVSLLAIVLLGVSLIAPVWVVGVLCVFVIPTAVGCWVLNALLARPKTDTDRYCSSVDLDVDRLSRRRNNLLCADYAHQTPLTSPVAAHPQGQARPVPPSAGRAARPDVVSAWVDFAWATHHLSLHRYRVTRPGR